MMQIVVFALALVAVFAVNAVIAVRTRDDLVANSTSFCWMSVTEHDAETAARAAEEPASAPSAPVAPHTIRQAASASI